MRNGTISMNRLWGYCEMVSKNSIKTLIWYSKILKQTEQYNQNNLILTIHRLNVRWDNGRQYYRLVKNRNLSIRDILCFIILCRKSWKKHARNERNHTYNYHSNNKKNQCNQIIAHTSNHDKPNMSKRQTNKTNANKYVPKNHEIPMFIL